MSCVARGDDITALDLAMRYYGIGERPDGDHPLIQWWLELCSIGEDSPDETPWCSAFVNGVCWELRLPRSKSAAARSWLSVGVPVMNPIPGWDVSVFWRDSPDGWKGHVGFYAGQDEDDILIVSGNDNDVVRLGRRPSSRLLGHRRLRW